MPAARPDAGAVAALLEETILGLELTDRAAFVTKAMAEYPPEREVEVVPVIRADGAVEGELRCGPLQPREREAVERLAAQAALAFQAIRYAEELRAQHEGLRQVAKHLQDALLPELPELANTTLAVRYRAAGSENRVGGDFYDVFPLPDGLVLIVVGDVTGKGIQAAHLTSRITQTLRALALQHLPVDQMLERCDEQMRFQEEQQWAGHGDWHPEGLATVWCGLYNPTDGELEFCSLGHPPALLLRADGEPIRLELAGLPLGMRDLSPEQPEIRRRQLGPRDLLVLYTDGVVEGSGDYLAGQEDLLRAIASRRDEPLADVIEGALDELRPVDPPVNRKDWHTDDALMLLLRRRG